MVIFSVSDKFKLYAIYSLYIGVAIFLIGSTIAMLTFPDYSLSENYFSDTGLRVDYQTEDRGFIEAHPYPEIFNVTLYLLAIFILPFNLIVSSFFTREEDGKYLFTLATIPGLVITPSMIGVGFWDYGNAFDEHVLAAQILMGAIGFFFIIWTLGVIFLPEDAKYKQFKSWKWDPFVTILIIFFAFTQVWGVPNIPLIEDVNAQVYQKLVPYTTIPYLSFVAYRLRQTLDMS